MFDHLPSQVRLVEVGPRDGLQNEKVPISTEDKKQFIQLLLQAGCQDIEVTSFVNPKAIPQLSDAKTLYPLVKPLSSSAHFSCLVPNLKGLELALESGVEEIAIFTATSETFNQKNIQASTEESMNRICEVMTQAMKKNLRVRGYISTAFGCPYEGETSLDILIKMAKQLLDWGAYEISIGDTIGVAHPLQVQKTLNQLLKYLPSQKLALHMHDTKKLAATNNLVGLEMGITSFDCSAGGLGGCPYAPGASGNVATEQLVYLFESMGIHTGIDLSLLKKASGFILNKLNH